MALWVAEMNRGGRTADWIDFDAAIYQDRGCPDLGIPSCLSCPLPQCRYDMGPKAARAYQRMGEVAALVQEGLTADEIAARLGVASRTVKRHKARLRALAEENG